MLFIKTTMFGVNDKKYTHEIVGLIEAFQWEKKKKKKKEKWG